MDVEQQGHRVSRVFFVVLWIVLLIGSLFLLITFLRTFIPISLSRRLFSLDWAGYVVVSDYANPQPLVVGISSSWTVPTINASLSNRFSAAWIGIGGQTDSTLIQAGTEHDSVDGKASYYAWYEMLPSDSITISSMTISPGDKITASISLADVTASKWTIEIDDVTRSEQFKQDFVYQSSQLCGEWIVERPTVNNSFSSLANFGHITFENVKIVMNSTVGSISSFPYYQVTMQNRQNRQLVTVSNPSSGGSIFSVSYLTSPV
jgi:hypothetical protein